MRRVGSILVMLVIGTIGFFLWGEDPKAAACVRDIDLIESAYRTSRPKAESHKAIERTLTHARTWCGEEKFELAEKAMDIAAFLCVAQKGCQPLLDEARRVRSTSR
jgi:hypothetical protein